MKLSFLDLFFPKKCLGCGKAGTYICQDCFNKIEPAQIDRQQKPANLDCLIWAVPYANPLAQKLIKAFKYNYIKELVKPLAQLLTNSPALCWILDFQHSAVVMAVPLHKQKLRERGFNQAELLAEKVAEHFSLPLETEVLIRKKYTPQQARKKSDKERKEALKNAFEIAPEFIKKCAEKNENLLRDKTVILVDDVFTTGATLCESAKILKKAGAKEIIGLVVAKG